jgi:hypothetical protein
MVMKRSKPEPEHPGYVGDHADKLRGIRPHRHDEDDDRPSGEDRKPLTSQLFSSPVPLPRFLKSRKER